MDYTVLVYLYQGFLLVVSVNHGMTTVKIVHSDPLQIVQLSCTTNAERVFWMSDSGLILSFDKKGVENHKRDKRYSLVHQYETERDLRIDLVKKQDAGNYTCRSGKEEYAKYQLIINSAAEIPESTNDIEVRELSTVGLWCNASGIPTPTTTWYVVYEDGMEHQLGISGRYLEIRNITRGCGATYRCKSANRLNGNSPAVADMRINIVYPPEVDISLDGSEDNVDSHTFDNDTIEYTVYYRVPESRRSKVILTCHVNANPTAVITWKVGEQIIGTYKSEMSLEKPDWEESYLYGVYSVREGLQIHIDAYGQHDILFGKPYKCVSKNSIAEDHCSVQFMRVK